MSNRPSLRVLLAEDSSLLAVRLSELIAQLPDVELIATVETEADAISHIPSCLPHVVILDLHLRGGSGFEVLRSMGRDRLMWPKVIVLTNFGLQEYRRQAEALGADVFLDKSRDYFRLPTLLSDFAKALCNESSPQS